MKSKIISFLIGCTGALIGAYLYLSGPLRTGKVISCQSLHTIIQNDFRLEANYGFIIGDNKGELTIYGYSKENGVRLNIRRAIGFTYTKTDNIYRLQSTRIESISGDKSAESNVNVHLPAFFYQTGKDLTMQITRDEFNVPVIFVHNMPMFYCKKPG